MSEIGIICPTRRGSDEVARMVKSMAATSTKAHALIYLDDDGPESEPAYREKMPNDLISITRGPRVGSVASANMLANDRRFQIYGMVPDDAEFKTPGWDDYLIETMNSLPNKIGVVAAHHNCGPFVNFPFVSRKWLDTVGWYFYPNNYHFCCDSILQMLGEATKIVYAPEEKFSMWHHGRSTFNIHDYPNDANGFLVFCVQERQPILDKIRGAMNA